VNYAKDVGALARLVNAIEPREERQILERRQLAVHERLVAEVADGGAERKLDRSGVARRQPGENAQQRRLAGAVPPGDEQEAFVGQVDVDTTEHAPVAEALLEAARSDHER